ncbi:NDR1/HIN1-like protein 13 isoform X3 [Abrus precatorius]|nr:NDR1/HIN1-like protein 13 isoform X3 [Abrus precatorius]
MKLQASLKKCHPNHYICPTTMSLRETNPHFSRPSRPQHVDGSDQPSYAFVPSHRHRGQPPTQGAAPVQNVLQPQHEDHVPLRTQRDDHFPLPMGQEDHPHTSILREPRRGQSHRGASRKQPQDQGLTPAKSKVIFQEQSPKAGGSAVLPTPDHPTEPRWRPRQDHRHTPIRLPKEQKSQPLTWLGACLCVIFWLVIIIGGLIVLIVYLVFRPQSPHFDVSGATLNAAYLDLGYLLNADLSLLANFTNPNKKVHVDFSSVMIYLYYGSTLIATQYVEPFSAARRESRLANIRMVTSQVQLPLRETQRLVKQMEGNGVLLQVNGVFRARSKLGSILRYSYNLYGRCNILLTSPPGGVLLKKKCRTKR